MKQREIRSWLMDMDGVLVHEQSAIPGADRFLERLREKGLPFLVLTNNSIYTRRDLDRPTPHDRSGRSRGGDLDLGAGDCEPSHGQRPGGTAFAIGEALPAAPLRSTKPDTR